MLDQVDLNQKLSKEEYKRLCAPLKKQLSVLQQTIKEKRLPVVVVFEGWSAAGKGSLLSDVILTLDPRGFQVYSTVAADAAEARKPLLWRYWVKIPAEGNFPCLTGAGTRTCILPSWNRMWKIPNGSGASIRSIPWNANCPTRDM